MKEKIIYIFVFLTIFLITTGSVIYLNNNYTDIFKLNFKPIVKHEDSSNHDKNLNTNNVSMDELKNVIQTEFKNYLVDSLKKVYSAPQKNTVVAEVKKDSSLADSVKNLRKIINKIDRKLAEQEAKNTQVKINEDNEKTKSDSAYINWTHQTAKLYEAMDPKQAAKIIQSYSDNIARDIIYSMRQKKAAEVLSELNPQTANRITQAKSNAF